MKIHVVTEKSWICRTLAEHLANLDGFRVRVTNDPPRDASLTYYVTYLFREFYKPVGRSVGLFTHYEDGSHRQRYDRLAKQVDHCVVLSAQHEGYLKRLVGSDRVTRCYLPVSNKPIEPVLRVGWFHRSPQGYGRRKRVDLLDRVRELPWVRLSTSDGALSSSDLHARMQDVDVFLTTSDYESGPMSLLEGLSLNKTVVIPEGVGMANEFDIPEVVRFRRGDADDLVRVLSAVYDPIRRRCEALRPFTVERWRSDHARIFRSLLRQ